MIRFQTITSFRGRLKALVEYKKGVYSGVSDEIKSAFTNVSISQIRNNRDMILMQNDALLIKLRLPDHKTAFRMLMAIASSIWFRGFPKRWSFSTSIPKEALCSNWTFPTTI